MTDFYDFYDLYELTGKFEWIKQIVIQYNKLGFYTVASQPGKISIIDKHNNIVRKQRAYIRGYMHIDMANYIISKINTNSNPYIFVRSETNNKILDKNKICTCGSVIFINDIPGTMDFDSGKYDQSFNFNLPLRRSYEFVIKNDVYDGLPKNLNPQDITEFDILELNFNTNDFWIYLLKIIEEFNCIRSIHAHAHAHTHAHAFDQKDNISV